MRNNKDSCRILHPTEEHQARSESTGNFKDMSKMQSNGGTLELALNSGGLDVVSSIARVAGGSVWSNVNSINRWCIYSGFWMDHVIHTGHWAVKSYTPSLFKGRESATVRAADWAAQILLHASTQRRVRSGRMLFVFAFKPCSSNEWLCPARATLQHVVSGPDIMRL